MTPTRRILLVDDDTEIRQLVRMTLPPDGLEVVEAADGDDALRLLAELPPELVVLDWKMPRLSRDEVLTELRTRHPTLPVIVLTAEVEDHHRVRAQELGRTRS